MTGENPSPRLSMTALGITSLAYTVPFLKALTYIHTYIHTYTLLMLPKWAFQLNRIRNTNLYKLIKNVSTIIL